MIRHPLIPFVAALGAAVALPACAQQRTLTPEQKSMLQERLKAADTNGDGLIDKAEAEAGLPRLAKRFDALDGNGDGKLSPEELRAAGQKMSARGGR